MQLNKSLIFLFSILTTMLFIITCLYNPFVAIGGDTNSSSSTSSSNILYQYDFSDAEGTTPPNWTLAAAYGSPRYFECTSDKTGFLTTTISDSPYNYSYAYWYYTGGTSWTKDYSFTFTYFGNSGTSAEGQLRFGICYTNTSHYYSFTKNRYANVLSCDLTGDGCTWTLVANNTWSPWLTNGDKITVKLSRGATSTLQVIRNYDTSPVIQFSATTTGTPLSYGSIGIGCETNSGTAAGQYRTYNIDNILVTTP